MKASLVLIPVLSVFFAVATCYVYNEVSEPPSAAEAGDGERARYVELERKFDALESKLDTTLEKLATMQADQRAAAEARKQAGGKVIASGARVGEVGKSAGARAEIPARIAAVLQDEAGEAALREFVADVIQNERDERDQRRREKFEARRREHRELAQGPYGKHNFRVNSVGKKLSLSTAQKDVYFDLLERYAKERQNLHHGEDGKSILSSIQGDPAQMAKHFEQVHQQEKALREQFDEEFAQSLTDDQYELYKNLPEHEKRGMGGPMIFSEAINLHGDGADGKVIFSTATRSLGGGEIPEGVVGEALRAVESAIIDVDVSTSVESESPAPKSDNE